MVKAKTSRESLQRSPQKLPGLKCMSSLLKTRQQECLPSLTEVESLKFSLPVPLQGSSLPRLHSLRTDHINEASECPNGFLSEHRSLCPTQSQYFDGKRIVVPGPSFNRTCPKGFFIFDQSENQTRLIYNYFCHLAQNPGYATNAGLVSDKCTAQTDQIGLTKNMQFRKVSETNDESEMREDTEEIDALLDSEDDEDEYGEGDEVTSTDRFPTQTIGLYQRRELVGELLEEVASSDGPNKRQKKHDGRYNKTSPEDNASSIKIDVSHDYDNDAKSSYADGPIGIKESNCMFGYFGPKKDKIRRILRILESIIPGVKGKDPVLVIDEAIDYLSITKIRAETLGVSFH